MKQSPKKLGERKAVSALGAATAPVIEPRAGVVSATKIELVAATVTKTEAPVYTTAKVAPGAEVEAAGAPARAVDQVGADVPPASVYVHERLL
jgi:hypothetical protein